MEAVSVIEQVRGVGVEVDTVEVGFACGKLEVLALLGVMNKNLH